MSVSGKDQKKTEGRRERSKEGRRARGRKRMKPESFAEDRNERCEPAKGKGQREKGMERRKGDRGIRENEK